MQEKSLRIYSTEKTFFNKVSNTLSKLLIPTKVGINGIIINMKRNNLLKAYDNYNANLNKVENFPYFTDSAKKLTGTARPEFMTLAPNSITKLRIYIYIEGQDIDNYDFAQIGKKISVNFGFTKERFETEDVSYSGPSFNVPAPNNNVVYELTN